MQLDRKNIYKDKTFLFNILFQTNLLKRQKRLIYAMFTVELKRFVLSLLNFC